MPQLVVAEAQRPRRAALIELVRRERVGEEVALEPRDAFGEAPLTLPLLRNGRLPLPAGARGSVRFLSPPGRGLG